MTSYFGLCVYWLISSEAAASSIHGMYCVELADNKKTSASCCVVEQKC